MIVINMRFVLAKLPYAFDTLEPVIDAKTMEIHHDKHHQTYCDKLNAALDKHPEIDMTAEELLIGLNKIPSDIRTAVKNHGGGYVNHSLYWEIITPNKKDREFKGKLAEEINKKWGTFEKFKEELANASINHFGSGWGWLVINNEAELEIITTSNQDSPLSLGLIPILCIDVWEHSYYLKYQNKRADYVNAFFSIINWKKVNELFEKAISKR